MNIRLPRLRFPSPSHHRRRFRQAAAVGLLIILATATIGVCKLGETLLVPKRREPGDWQNAVLDEPARHGVVIERFSTFAEDGIGIQALLVRPSRTPGSSTRYCEMRRRLGDGAMAGAIHQSIASVRKPKTWGDVRGTVFLLHGRSGIKEDGITIAERFAAAGLATVLFDSRGHGESPGRCMSYGMREIGDLSCLISAVQSRYADEGDAGVAPLMVFGNSMGAAVTLQALPHEKRLCVAVVVSPFADLWDLVGEMLKRRMPVGTGSVRQAVSTYALARAGMVLKDICPEQAAAEICVPTMVIHGDCDGVIPIAHGERVFAAITDERKVWRSVDGGQHGNVLMHGGDDLYEEMIRFLLDAVSDENTANHLAVHR